MSPMFTLQRSRRARLLTALLLPALASGIGSGCSHRRQSMRPVYLAPAPVVTAPCEGADCPPGTSSSVQLSPPTLDPSELSPSPSSVGSPILSSPATSAPSYINESPPPVTGPSLPGLSDEPSLEPAPAPTESSRVKPLPGGSGNTNGTNKGASNPGPSSRNPGARIGTTARPRRAALREEVEPLVNDPADLFAPPKADRPWKYIVLHHSASPTGGYASIDQEHRKRLGWDGCGYHFVIGNGTDTPDGLIEVARRWSNQKHGVHCRDGKHPDVNEYGIGICLVGDLESGPPTPRQIESARALVAFLSDRYAIPASRAETHSVLAASATACPGRHFPSQAILGGDVNRGLVQR